MYIYYTGTFTSGDQLINHLTWIVEQWTLWIERINSMLSPPPTVPYTRGSAQRNALGRKSRTDTDEERLVVNRHGMYLGGSSHSSKEMCRYAVEQQPGGDREPSETGKPVENEPDSVESL